MNTTTKLCKVAERSVKRCDKLCWTPLWCGITFLLLVSVFAIAEKKAIYLKLTYEVGTASPFMRVPRIEMHHMTGDPEALWMMVPGEWQYGGLYKDPNDVQYIKLEPKVVLLVVGQRSMTSNTVHTRADQCYYFARITGLTVDVDIIGPDQKECSNCKRIREKE